LRHSRPSQVIDDLVLWLFGRQAYQHVAMQGARKSKVGAIPAAGALAQIPDLTGENGSGNKAFRFMQWEK
jgi:hypothetical protein